MAVFALRYPRRMAGGLAAVVLLMAWSAGCSYRSADVRSSQRAAAPDFALTDGSGATVRLSDYKGRVVLVNFWATYCTGCKVEMPWLMEFEEQYGAQGLTSIGLAMDYEGWEIVRPYLSEHPINFPVVLGDAVSQKQYDVYGLPKTVLIDRQGRIAHSHLGVIDRTEWGLRIQQLLRESAD